MDMTTTKPSAGWYTDPANSSNERWWGGIDWTDHTRPIAAFAPNPPTAQLAIPSAHAAHAATSQHIAESPLVGSTAQAAAPAFTAPPTFSVTTPEPAPPYASAPAPAFASAPAPAFATAPAPAFAPPAPAFAAAPAPSLPAPAPAAPAPTYTAAPAPAAPAPAPAYAAAPVPAFTPPPAPAFSAPPAPAAAAPAYTPTDSGSALVIVAAPAGTAPIPPASGGMAAMSKEAAVLEVTIPQYASQLETAKAPLLGAMVAAWEAQPAPAGYTGTPGTPEVYDFSAMFQTPAEPVAYAPSVPAEAPKNGKAIAGFVLSLLGFSLFGLIFSILGLRQAREFESMDLKPAGRVLARWGVALAVISMVLSAGVGVLYVTMWPTIAPLLVSYIPQ